MAISGLVITLCDDAERAEAAVCRLASEPRLELGPQTGRRLAVVADTRSPRADRELWEALHRTDGVTHVDVVYVRFEDDRPCAPDDKEPSP
jgi:hypothetical protein